MPGDLENAIRDAAVKIARYLEDSSELSVETRYVEVGADGVVDFSQGRPVAQTVLQWDGDSLLTVPVRRTGTGGIEVDAALLELHERNVTAAVESRARTLTALLSLIQGRGGR